ncbi:methylenetetrahydrofolate reductase (NADPH) [Cladophialophora psammophila CBS 110553]|uniref:Methylenetetrahydrofolate reductase (NADPH) n=1 Tax=Cladophialophora psammophila CBS 110553 TaxID=1182543 RepID=W9XHR9_9EURO|nr:methylenetetrahydrofolate reductase (NADPH) [Cladophialophora psammophila CBS 110553]EXJ76491.1 methylenetetrahydrofolate reductase (NADPH) [Cladophialophora psammophila CBS 110553]
MTSEDDDRLPTLLASLPPSSYYFSLEFFPPKTSSGFSNLQARLTRMAAALRPLFVTVTWGAGGSTATKSLELAEVCQRQIGLTTVLHLTCTNMKRHMIDEALEGAKEIGIRNILALRGDLPREEYKDTTSADENDSGSGGSGTESNKEFAWAVDLVRYIRRKHGDYFAVGVAGYPEGHADESHPEQGKQSVEHDLPYLAEKVAAGADFIMTQLTYDIEAYAAYEKRLREYTDPDGKKLFEKIPVIPGLMPIQSYQIIKRITKLSHAKLPRKISERIERVKSDDEAVKKVGVDILSELVEEMKTLPQPEGLPRGFHFYTLNLEKSVSFILERTGLIPLISSEGSVDGKDDDSVSDSEVVVDDSKQDSPAVVTTGPMNSRNENGQQPTSLLRRRRSSVNAQPHNRVITDRRSDPRTQSRRPDSDTDPPGVGPGPNLKLASQHSARDRGTGIPAASPTRRHNLLISEGQGSLGREATWDDFPNGRWGPSHSPAFGEIDGYGPSLKVSPLMARKLWGYPRSREDVTELFRRHVLGELVGVPWSDDIDTDLSAPNGTPTNVSQTSGALRAETDVIRSELLSLISSQNYWTLASQPAVDGAPSSDPIFGWGPPGEGFVFQKAFVEFFCGREEWEEKLRPRLMKYGSDVVGWMKTDNEGVFESSELVARDQARNKKTSPVDTEKENTIPVSTPQLSNQKSATTTSPVNTVNAVTWGVFPSREILTPTIIEAESFRAWAQEAYAIWHEWKRCFPRGSQEAGFLEKMGRENVLVNVVGQSFRGGHDGGRGEGARLWTILLEPDDETKS